MPTSTKVLQCKGIEVRKARACAYLSGEIRAALLEDRPQHVGGHRNEVLSRTHPVGAFHRHGDSDRTCGNRKDDYATVWVAELCCLDFQTEAVDETRLRALQVLEGGTADHASRSAVRHSK